MSNTNRPGSKDYRLKIGLQLLAPFSLVFHVCWNAIAISPNRPSIHPGLEDLFTQTDFFSLPSTLFLSEHPSHPHSWGTMGREPAFPGLLCRAPFLPWVLSSPWWHLLLGSFGGGTRPISKSERAVGWKINNLILTCILISEEGGGPS